MQKKKKKKKREIIFRIKIIASENGAISCL